MLYTWCQGDAGCILGVSSVMGCIMCARVVQVVSLVEHLAVSRYRQSLNPNDIRIDKRRNILNEKEAMYMN